MNELKGKSLVPGKANGELIVSEKPISFLGDIDPETGRIVAEGHPLKGESVKNKIFAFPCGKGSTVGSYVLFQMKKNNVAPKAIINEEAEAIVAVGAIISNIPMISGIELDNLKSGERISLDCETGTVKSDE